MTYQCQECKEMVPEPNLQGVYPYLYHWRGGEQRRGNTCDGPFVDEEGDPIDIDDAKILAERHGNIVIASVSDHIISEAPSKFKKDDAWKPKMHFVPKEPLLEIAKVAEWGAKKYSEKNWQECDDPNRYLDALYRHVFAYESGEETDPETGMSHLAHAGCCLLFLMWLQGRGREAPSD